MFTVPTQARFRGEISIPGDKSISHRSVLFGAIARGKTHIKGFLPGADCLATIRCCQQLGATAEQLGETEWLITSEGYEGLREPDDILDVGNSGTTIRLMLGLLAGRPWATTLTGDRSIRRRPMGRVTRPLQQMGATFLGRKEGTLAPLTIHGGDLRSIDYVSSVASAQVKSAILLAGLQTEGETRFIEPTRSRNHTELMLPAFGAELHIEGNSVSIHGPQTLEGTSVTVPGDISSAAFFLIGAAITPGSDLIIRNVGINPTRSGILDVLTAMGADWEFVEQWETAGEPVAAIRIRYSELKGTVISGDLIPRLVDEIPIIALAATQAEGVTEIRDAEELRVKESDRLAVMSASLRSLGAQVEDLPDGLRIIGPTPLKGGAIETQHDHRIAMTFAIAAQIASGEINLDDVSCIETSFPNFFSLLS